MHVCVHVWKCMYILIWIRHISSSDNTVACPSLFFLLSKWVVDKFFFMFDGVQSNTCSCLV